MRYRLFIEVIASLLLTISAALVKPPTAAATTDRPDRARGGSDAATSQARADKVPAGWRREWPRTDFSKAKVPFYEILSGGPPKDGIRAIDRPRFDPVTHPALRLSDDAPVIAFVHAGVARAYPLAILARHEIVNDRIAHTPVAITYCPLCNAAIVFVRRLPDGQETTFGTTGKLRNSDLVMYDRSTESWWQQFTGRGIVGRWAGARLERLSARIESFGRFRTEHPDGSVLSPPATGFDYSRAPYAGYDRGERPWFSVRRLPREVPPMSLVVAVGDRAWSLALLRRKGRIETKDGIVLEWRPGARSIFAALDGSDEADIWGDVQVRRKDTDGEWHDIPFGLDFAFAFASFHPRSRIVTQVE
ncbi:MAG: DUF3179 domain-containing protein [Alphaproteobacteria bacterium]|nr:MAG: DUF3179 domain-containing protein [Alphaproteobacteria bacterium]